MKQLGEKSGKVYVTVTNSKQRVSGRSAVSYKAEKNKVGREKRRLFHFPFAFAEA